MGQRLALAGLALGVTLLSLPGAPVLADAALGTTSAARVSQQIGTTEIAVTYDSPAAQERRIWGAAVPYDKPWPTSTDHPTTIQFTDAVRIADQPVPAGTYRLSCVPGRLHWTLSLEPDVAAANENTPSAAAPIRFTAAVRSAPFRERLTFLFSDVGAERTSLELEWERIRVTIPIATRAAERVAAEMKELDGAWQSYANAARYMLETEKDFDAGLRYADQSLALRPDWYTYWIKAALLAAKHDYRAAVEQGEHARDLGKQQLGSGFLLEGQLDRTLAVWKRTPAPRTGPAATRP